MTGNLRNCESLRQRETAKGSKRGRQHEDGWKPPAGSSGRWRVRERETMRNRHISQRHTRSANFEVWCANRPNLLSTAYLGTPCIDYE